MNMVLRVVEQYAFPSKLEYLFAFSFRPRSIPPGTGARRWSVAFYEPIAPSFSARRAGWDVYNVYEEFARQHVLDFRVGGENVWRVTDLNRAYELCPTYPSVLLVPGVCRDEVRSWLVRAGGARGAVARTCGGLRDSVPRRASLRSRGCTPCTTRPSRGAVSRSLG